MNLKDKTVVITGASSGFGEACAWRFASAGARLVLLARREVNLQKVQADLLAAYPDISIHIAPMDVQIDQQVDALPDLLPFDFQKVDILVNNAGLALGLNAAWEAELEQWDQMINTNCRALVRMTRRILPGMVERNSGHIINIGSVAGNWPYPGGNVYGATKAFVQQFSRNLRCDLLGKNIRVTNIEPGMADTEFSLVRFSGEKQLADKVYEGTKPLAAEDVAETIFWASSLPEHVNINTLEVMPTCQAWSPFAVNRNLIEK
jgi:NADP-dependent 3-hydroxy acid dehydrogenase YdfG